MYVLLEIIQNDYNSGLYSNDMSSLSDVFSGRVKMDAHGQDEEGRAASPGCVSLKSDQSKDIPLTFSNEPGQPNPR